MRQVSAKLTTWLNDFNKLFTELVENGFIATPTNAREGLANLTSTLITEVPDIALIQDDLVAGGDYAVPVRIYHPEPKERLPVLVYYHGGGHMAGSVTVYDPICRKLALATKHIVVSVDYRLAPECPYPAALNDAYSVVQNLWVTLDRRHIHYLPRLSIAGDSGGGALVASVSTKAQFDDEVTISKQVMVYPSLDYTMESPSMEQNGTGYLVQKRVMTPTC